MSGQRGQAEDVVGWNAEAVRKDIRPGAERKTLKPSASWPGFYFAYSRIINALTDSCCVEQNLMWGLRGLEWVKIGVFRSGDRL